jgi:hypothetical protein
MEFESYIMKYMQMNNYSKWSLLGILEYLSNNIHFTSENLDDIVAILKKQLEIWSKDSNILQTAKNKATKMVFNLNETVKRREIKAFLDNQDLKSAEVIICFAIVCSDYFFLIIDLGTNHVEAV